MEEQTQKMDTISKAHSEVEGLIKQITENGLQTSNVDLLYRLIDIHKDIENEIYWKIKEECMMNREYDGYGRGRARDSRGRYMDSYGRYNDSYGRRGRRYRGYDYLDGMMDHYGNYSESRDSYGTNDRETEKSFEEMLECFEGFAITVMEEANDPTKVEKIKRVARKISEM